MTKEEQFERLPSQQYLLECFQYDAEAGRLVWRERPLHHFLSANRSTEWEMKRRNSALAGRPFGSKNTHGHIRGGVNGARYYAHRLIWKIVHGDEPQIIDHINGDPSDNRICNLRNGSRSDNQRNLKRSSANTSGTPGVYKHKQAGGWYARINSTSGKNISFYSKSRDEVEAWRKSQEQKFGYSGRANA